MRRLVEGRVGKAMTEAVAKALQARMFERKDGVWLFPQMVMDDAARAKMTARAKELLANEGAFASVKLRDESLCLRNGSLLQTSLETADRPRHEEKGFS